MTRFLNWFLDALARLWDQPWFHDLIWRALHTAWQTFLAAWPTGAVFTDWGAWRIAGAAALTALVAAIFSGIKTGIVAARSRR